MNSIRWLFTLSLLIAPFTGCSGEKERHHDHHDHEVADNVERGPHGGKLFRKDNFAIEVTIYEPGIPPQSHVYAYENNRPIDPAQVTLTTELHRIDRVDTIHYTSQDDHLVGDKTVDEPHSFDVTLKATWNGQPYEWSYSSYEGRTTISPQAVAASGIEIEKAGGRSIATTVSLPARIVVDSRKVTELSARFPGVIKEIRKLPGATVEKGEVLATIEASESLKEYQILSPRAGEIFDVTSAAGQVTGTAPLITVGDLSSVWLDLVVPRSHFDQLKAGQKVILPERSDGAPRPAGTITHLSPVADGETQTRFARAEIENPDRALVPGLFVDARIVIRERQVPVAIRAEALQTFRDWDVVFKKVGDIFEIAILELGEVDGEWIEVKKGLEPGTEYATRNSFVVKADVMKSGATHDH